MSELSRFMTLTDRRDRPVVVWTPASLTKESTWITIVTSSAALHAEILEMNFKQDWHPLCMAGEIFDVFRHDVQRHPTASTYHNHYSTIRPDIRQIVA